MHQATLDDLIAADDPVHFECPPGFDRAAELARVAAVREPLERLTGYRLEQEMEIEGASFFTDLAARDPLPQRRPGLGPIVETFLNVRFSAFGRFFTVGSSSSVCPLSDQVRAEVVECVCKHGYVHVPDALLALSHPRFRAWWYRYFDHRL
jgi:hypothetical protein